MIEAERSLVRIRSYKARLNGLRGLVVELPQSWADDVGIRRGTRLDVFRDPDGRLIIVAAKRKRRAAIASTPVATEVQA